MEEEKKLVVGDIVGDDVIQEIRFDGYAKGFHPHQQYGWRRSVDLKFVEELSQKHVEKLQQVSIDPYIDRDDDITIGSDPEIWVCNGDGTIIPACSFLPDAKKGAASSFNKLLFNDGFQAEFNATPSICINGVVDSIQQHFDSLLTTAKQKFPKENVKLVAAPIMPVAEPLLMAAKPEHVMMGCLPSKNLYKTRGKPIVDGREVGIRFAGFHIHIGYRGLTEEQAQRAVRAMDALVALPSVVLVGKSNSEKLRRDYYGQAGEYRLPKHGLEYRTISATLLKHPVWVHMMFDAARFAFQLGIRRLFEVHWKTSWEDVRDVVNAANVKEARKILASEPLFDKYLNLRYSHNAYYGDVNKYAEAKGLFAGTHKLKSETLEKNWKLGTATYGLGGWGGHSDAENCNVMKMVCEAA